MWTITNVMRETVTGNVPQVVISCDSADDVANLPTDYSPNSVAIIADTGLPVAILNASGQWVTID